MDDSVQPPCCEQYPAERADLEQREPFLVIALHWLLVEEGTLSGLLFVFFEVAFFCFSQIPQVPPALHHLQ